MNELLDRFRRLQQLYQVGQHFNLLMARAGKPDDQVGALTGLPFDPFRQLKNRHARTVNGLQIGPLTVAGPAMVRRC